MMNNTKLKKGGIDTIIAYIVVILPLVYILAFIIAIIYHFSVQGYIAQVAKELAISASTHGEITQAMEDRVVARLNSLNIGEFQIAIKVREYKEETDAAGKPVFYFDDPDTYGWNSVANTPMLDSSVLKQKSTVAVYLQSQAPSLLATVANFGLFGGAGTPSTLNYSAFREEIVRYAPDP